MKTLQCFIFDCKKIISIIIFIIITCNNATIIAAAKTWDGGGGADTNWSTAANWDNNTLPATNDEVTITGVYTVTVNSDIGTINKLVLSTSAAGAPTLQINSGGKITISASAAVSGVILIGGIIQNNGELIITTSTGASHGMEFRNSSSTTPIASSYSGSGTLTINSTASTTSNCIYFTQNNAVPVFSLGIGNTSLLSASAVHVISVLSGSQATINGTGSITIGSSGTPASCGLILITSNASATSTLTVETGVTLSIYSTMTSTTNGPVRLTLTANEKSITFLNKGTINIGGTCVNGIYSNSAASTSNPLPSSNFENQGTVNFTGAFNNASAAPFNYGGAGVHNFTNSGTISIGNMTSTSSKGFYMTNTHTVNFTNSGIITFESSNATTGAMMSLGDNKTVFNNTGTVTINKGFLGASGSAVFNNNAGGKLTIAGDGTPNAIVSAVVTNNGLFEANGTINNGCYVPSTGTISPGGATGIGKITIYTAASGTFNLTGKAIMNVNGKTTAGTDYDQIAVTTTGSTLDVSGATLEVNVGGSYTPANNDVVSLFTGQASRTGNFSAVTLPSLNWAMDYGANFARIKFSTLPATIIASGQSFVLSNNTSLSDLTINSGGSLTVNPGKQLSISSTMSNSGTLNLLSDNTNGTATIITPATIGGSGATYNVQQYVSSTQTGVNGRNWYISSPLTAATSNTITTATGNGLVYYNGSTWVDEGATMEVMKGYIAKSPAQNTTINFTGGTLNTGDKSVTNLPSGFNLVGNPYASYVDFAQATKTNVTNSIWYRSKKDGAYNFHTYNVTGGISVKDGTAIIPPMQSFWIKTTSATNEFGFTNNMRSHQDQSVVSNRLKARKADTQQLLRLQVSNGTYNDEAVIYFNENAQNGFDNYDSPKMFNNISVVPEIFTQIASEKLVINGMKEIPYNVELPLGFTTLQANQFSISAKEFKNFDTDVRIILKDKSANPVVETDLTEGQSYSFYADATPVSTSKFSLILRSPSVTTGLDGYKPIDARVYVSDKNKINIETDTQCNFVIYDLVGSTVTSGITGDASLSNKTFNKGIYIVRLNTPASDFSAKVIIE